MELNEIVRSISELQDQILRAKNSPATTRTERTSLQENVSALIRRIAGLPNEYLIHVSELFAKMVSDCDLDRFFETEIIYTYLANHIVAYSLQINWKLENLSKQLSKIESKILKYLNLKDTHFFSFGSRSMRNKKQYLGYKSYLKLKFFLIYVETLLQHTAVLSQLGIHDKALKKAVCCFKTLKVGQNVMFDFF